MSTYYRTQQTYKGKTADQWLARATTAETMAGTVEIVTPDLPDCVLILTERETLVIVDFVGQVVTLTLDVHALLKMQNLTDLAESRMVHFIVG